MPAIGAGYRGAGRRLACPLLGRTFHVKRHAIGLGLHLRVLGVWCDHLRNTFHQPEIRSCPKRSTTTAAAYWLPASSRWLPPTSAEHAAASTPSSFGALKQINAGLLNVGYAEAGPANGTPVILLHGWPYDIHTYVDVAPLLAGAGYRVIVPYLRGYGSTRFLSASTARNGQQAALAVDAIALMDALKIESAVLGGCDWGARTACIMAALWPERAKALVSVSGYLIGSQELNSMPLPPKAEQEWWYQYLLRHRARPRRLREIQARILQAHLADRLAAVEVR